MPIEPNLFVNNLGKLELPLNEIQAQKLIQVCRQATYGLNSSDADGARALDKKVRDTHELDQTQFEIKNPEWGKQMDLLAQRAAEKMNDQLFNVSSIINATL